MDLSAVKYQQGGREVYATSMLTKDILALLPNREHPDIIEDANRRLFPAHAKGYGEYVVNVVDWATGSMMVGVDGSVISFKPASARTPNSGTLTIDENVLVFGGAEQRKNLVVVDGQHRIAGLRDVVIAAIQEAQAMVDQGVETTEIEERLQHLKDVLYEESIPVIFLVESNIDKLRQVYADISHVRTPDPITTAVFDTRSPFNMAARALAQSLPLLKGRVDMEKNTLTATSNMLLTLNQLSVLLQILYYGPAFRRAAARTTDDAAGIVERGTAFFDDLLEASEGLRDIAEGDSEPIDVRARGDLTASVTMLKILAAAYRDLVSVRKAERDDVAKYFASLPQRPTADKESVWVKAGILQATEERSTPLARSQEVRKAIDLIKEGFEAREAVAA